MQGITRGPACCDDWRASISSVVGSTLLETHAFDYWEKDGTTLAASLLRERVGTGVSGFILN